MCCRSEDRRHGGEAVDTSWAVGRQGRTGHKPIDRWSAFGGGQWNIGVGLVPLAAGGVGAISTYQSGLVLVGVLLVSEVVAQTRSVPPLQKANQAALMIFDDTQRSYSAVIATAWLISCSQTVFDHVSPKLLAVCASQSCLP